MGHLFRKWYNQEVIKPKKEAMRSQFRQFEASGRIMNIVSNEIRLVLADDHAVVRSGTRELLEQEPDLKIVGEASNGEEAVRLAYELQPDVMVMDVRMPKMSGVEATRRIKTESPDVRVLVLTAHDDDEYVFALASSGR